MKLRTNVFGFFGAFLRRQHEAAPSLERSPSSNPSSENNQATQERRASPRRYGDPVEVHLRTYEYLDAACGRTGWVRDRSAGGLGLTTEKPLEVGSWLRVRPTSVPDDVPWVDVMVRHCRPQGAKWVLGCQFVEPPPHELLLLFR